MRSPKDMHNIQIDITNACVHSCSNCTRFCGHHKKTFFMGFDLFRKAVDSVADFPGTVGIIGGEPTLHPEFERFIEYLREKRLGYKIDNAREPIVNLNGYMKHLSCWEDVVEKGKIGLWSSLNSTYYKYFELINESFPRQLLNDHNNACMHQALLMSRKELGINDEEWPTIRDRCWIQNTWSATITPKGAFFCEVAGALDMLFDGPGGWDIEPGWWKRTPEEFGEQLNWCEICGGCLDTPKRMSSDERDDVTPELYKRLIEVKSPKAEKGGCIVHDPSKYDSFKSPTFTGKNDYMKAGGNVRTTIENNDIYPKSVLLTTSLTWKRDIKEKGANDWVAIIHNEDNEVIGTVLKLLSSCILNPGCIYVKENEYELFNVIGRSVRDVIMWPNAMKNDVIEYYPSDKRVMLTKSLLTRLKKYAEQIDLSKRHEIHFIGGNEDVA